MGALHNTVDEGLLCQGRERFEWTQVFVRRGLNPSVTAPPRLLERAPQCLSVLPRYPSFRINNVQDCSKKLFDVMRYRIRFEKL